MSWSSTRKRLENEFLAPSLYGRISYFITRYHHAHDHAGRVAIRFDGEEVMKADYFNKYNGMYGRFHRLNELYSGEDPAILWKRAILEAENAGEFDEKRFYTACNEFFSQSIEESLASERMIVRILAVFDRRTGKRRLREMLAEVNTKEPIFRAMLFIRAKAEGIVKEEK